MSLAEQPKRKKEMNLKERFSAIGIDVVDMILDALHTKIESGEIDSTFALFVITHIFTNASPMDVRRILGISASDHEYKSSQIVERIGEFLNQVANLPGGR